jgi:hypothetical protein
MHRRLIRFLVVIAMALAIPVQGLAAVSAGVCMGLGHHQTAPGPAGHDHGADGDGADHSHDPQDQPSDSHCAPCAACCAAAHIAPAMPLFIPDGTPAALIAAAPFLPPGSLPESLDRPPLAP